MSFPGETGGRSSAARAAAFLCALWLAAGCGESTPEGDGRGSSLSAAAPGAEPDWRQDDRFRALLAPCPRSGFFDQDTSDVVHVMVQKLVSGQRDPIHEFKEELAAMGAAATPQLDRLVNRLYDQRDGVHGLRNVLGVLRLSDDESDLAHNILRRCLGHPAETVRAAAIRALTRHARPEDFDALVAALALARGEVRGEVVSALYRADPERLEEQLVAWIAEGQHRDVWPHAARAIAAGATADSVARLAPALETIEEPGVRTFLLAALARGGDEDALTALKAELEHADPARRSIALEALERLDRPELAIPLLLDDEVAEVRVLAAELVGTAADQDGPRAALRSALHDPSREVRQTALAALLSVGEPAAADLALALLDGRLGQMQLALLALRGHWEANPGLAERALALLDRRQRELAGRPLRDRQAVLQAIGQIPGRESARLLLELGRAAEGELGGLSAFRWHLLQIANTGPQGLAVVREAYAAERDPLRRIDLLWAVCFGSDEATRELLLSMLADEQAAPLEVLLAAQRLIRLGPALEVAPAIKRATLRIQDSLVRPALECLLWSWYGLP